MMRHVYALLADERRRMRRALIVGAVGGLCNAAMLPLVNWGIHAADTPGLVLGLVLGVALLGGGAVARRRAARGINRATVDAIGRRTRRLTDTLRRASLAAVEAHRGALGRVNRDLARLDRLPLQLRSKGPALPEMVAYAIYALWLSVPGFLLWALGTALLNRALQSTRSQKFAGLREVDRRWEAFDRRLAAFVEVFPRLRLGRAAMGAAIGELAAERVETRAALREVDALLRRTRVRSAVLPTLFIGTLIFTVERVAGLDAATAVQFGTLVLMARGPMSNLMAIDPLLEIEQALAGLDGVERALAARGADLPLPSDPAATFERIELSGVRFAYEGGFELGPVDLSLRRGELVLVVGHNGSGKTTLMKVLSGLYPPTRGRITVDGRVIAPAALRRLFTVTIIDAHLFDRAYGLRVDDAQIRAQLAELGIGDVVGVEGGRFTTVSLSSGQSRRLALAIALLEARPVLVLDEWDAHQDPLTTRYYFEELLPRLVAAGRTVIAVCHDDRYFEVGDRVVTLEGGRLVARRPADPG